MNTNEIDYVITRLGGVVNDSLARIQPVAADVLHQYVIKHEVYAIGSGILIAVLLPTFIVSLRKAIRYSHDEEPSGLPMVIASGSALCILIPGFISDIACVYAPLVSLLKL